MTTVPSADQSPLTALTPSPLWAAFAEICKIPHPSGQEAEIIALLDKRAKAAGLQTSIDQIGNLIVRKPATAGLENAKGVILQAHVDMVPQANSDTPHDFSKDPIVPRIVTQDGETWVKATGTTLGADNGIGVAAMLAIIEDTNLRHGPLEFVFTVEEETGLHGALALQPGSLQGSILINLDSEEDGDIVIGCAGGRDITTATPAQQTETADNELAFALRIEGLKGGHSGCDIHLGRGNAVRCLIHTLKTAMRACDENLRIADINGGTARNAIPREADATFVVPATARTSIETAIEQATAHLSAELAIADPGIRISCQPTALPAKALAAEASAQLIKVLNGCHNGIARLSDTLIGVPETSCNLGVIKTEGEVIRTVHMVRSNLDSARDALCEQIADTYAPLNSTTELSASYPGWAPAPDAKLLQTLSNTYQAQNGSPANITTLHAGLECAILGAPYPHWEMAAIGPTIRNPHSPDECVHVDSVDRFWKWLTAALEQVDMENK